MKKRSSTKPQPEYVFFTDRDLGRIIPDELERAGVRVERHDDHFSPTTPDTEWLREIGRRGWVAITHNKEIRYNPEERDMAMRTGVPLFMLIGHYTHPVLAYNLVHTLPRIVGFLERYEPPFIAKVYKAPDDAFAKGKPGRVVKFLLYDEWKKIVGK